jgi:DNA repair protein RecO (recombination protein O)
VAELLLELTHEYDPHPELFDAAVQTLAELSAASVPSASSSSPVAAVILRFELAALRLLGHLPSFGACAECGKEVARAGRMSFGLLSGGVLCEECRIGKRQLVSVSAGVIEALARFAAEDETWRTSELASAVRGELRGVLNKYLAHLIGHRPKMHEYLGQK